MRRFGWLFFAGGIVGAILTLVELIRAFLTRQMSAFVSIAIFAAATWSCFRLLAKYPIPSKIAHYPELAKLDYGRVSCCEIAITLMKVSLPIWLFIGSLTAARTFIMAANMWCFTILGEVNGQ